VSGTAARARPPATDARTTGPAHNPPAPTSTPPAPTPYPLAARELLRNTLLDAMGEQLQSKRMAEVTMADVAAAAGVSRQTLYNEFGSRGEFTQAFVLREVDRFLAVVEQAITERLEDPPAAVAAAFEIFLASAAENVMVQNILSGEGGGELLALVTTHGGPVLERASERLSALFRTGFPAVSPADASLLAEAVVRLAISYAALPTGSSRANAAALTRLLEPFVQNALGQARA
jgi:AcrR family transcriptional regulator